MSHLNHRHIKPSLDELPKRFVSAMKTLFDIMDDQKTGCINIRDIEARWSCGRDTSVALPNDVIDCLRKVTPPNGMISFERLCAGLKICLLRNRASRRQPLSNAGQRYRNHFGLQPVGQVTEPRGRPSSVPLPDRGEHSVVKYQPVPKPSSMVKSYCGSDRSLDNLSNNIAVRPSNTATVRPNIVTSQQRSVSVPHLQGAESGRLSVDTRRMPSKLRGYRSENRLAEPSARQESGILRFTVTRSKTPDPSVEIAKACSQIPSREPVPKTLPEAKGQKENRAPAQTVHETVSSGTDLKQGNGSGIRRVARKREPRRHTLGHGIEYSMLRRMKQLEQEKDMLLHGLRVVERARDWYLQRISSVQEKMQNTSKGHAAPEYCTDAHEERLRFQMARIFDVNQHLNALVESSDKGFPLHMNLAMQPPPYEVHQNSMVQRLKEQNHLLTEEVSRKSEVIAQLEQEKATLIRELFQARAQSRTQADETTLM